MERDTQRQTRVNKYADFRDEIGNSSNIEPKKDTSIKPRRTKEKQTTGTVTIPFNDHSSIDTDNFEVIPNKVKLDRNHVYKKYQRKGLSRILLYVFVSCIIFAVLIIIFLLILKG